MYAIIETGGKQLKVEQGQVVRVEKLPVPAGQAVSFERVLMVVDGSDVKMGQPLVSGAVVEATVLEHGKAPKVFSMRYKPKKRVRVKRGHRQPFTAVQITGIRC
ncbi:MAG: 50S ribosomal protein L21 [Bacillota bacterium]|jgi:large subunit ribosomal protein L21